MERKLQACEVKNAFDRSYARERFYNRTVKEKTGTLNLHSITFDADSKIEGSLNR